MQRQNSEAFEGSVPILLEFVLPYQAMTLRARCRCMRYLPLLALPSICGTSCSRVRYEIFKMSLIQVEPCWVIRLGR